MPPNTTQSNFALNAYLNLLNQPYKSSFSTLGEGLQNYDNKLKSDDLYKLQKQNMQNQADLGTKQLNWFDVISDADLQNKQANTKHTQAATMGENLRNQGIALENKFQKDTLPFKTTSAKTAYQAQTGQDLLKGMSMSDILNSINTTDPDRKDQYDSWLSNNVIGGKPQNVDKNKELYYGLLRTGDIPIDERTKLPQTYEQWEIARQNGSYKLNIHQTNALYKELTDKHNAMDQFFNELQRYNPRQYGLFDGAVRNFVPYLSPDAKIENAHINRLKSFVRDIIDKSNLSNQEQKAAYELVDGLYESATAENQKALADMLITGLENKLQAFKERGSFENKDTIERLENDIARFKNYRSQMDSWDGSKRLQFKNIPTNNSPQKPELTSVQHILQSYPQTQPQTSGSQKPRLEDFDLERH